ncbi:hypothetical protein BGX38DRAFT_391320 [Terfezia claveryi]|nr:hypothetical protein BGX38DRAFT_391320 [Terfezia claveryi]
MGRGCDRHNNEATFPKEELSKGILSSLPILTNQISAASPFDQPDLCGGVVQPDYNRTMPISTSRTFYSSTLFADSQTTPAGPLHSPLLVTGTTLMGWGRWRLLRYDFYSWQNSGILAASHSASQYYCPPEGCTTASSLDLWEETTSQMAQSDQIQIQDPTHKK